MRNIVGARIREARYRLGQKVTQEQLAARLQTLGLDLDRTAISKIEAGKRPVTDREIVGICKALGIKVARLFGEE
jgi:transcriptional regulator with XRE-family HTH domain